jgi:hypothetical protein
MATIMLLLASMGSVQPVSSKRNDPIFAYQALQLTIEASCFRFGEKSFGGGKSYFRLSLFSAIVFVSRSAGSQKSVI